MALAKGIWTNRKNQAKRYVAYMKDHGINPYQPQPYDVASYMVSLTKLYSSPATIANYLSGAKKWVELMYGNTGAFDASLPAMTKRGISKSSTHQRKTAEPVTPEDIRDIADYLATAGPIGLDCRAAFLVGYFSMMRQSRIMVGSSHCQEERHY